MADIDDEIRLYTGGLRASTIVSTSHSGKFLLLCTRMHTKQKRGLDISHVEEGIALTGNCLDRNIDKMYDIMAKLVHETNFDDVEKLKTLIIGVSTDVG